MVFLWFSYGFPMVFLTIPIPYSENMAKKGMGRVPPRVDWSRGYTTHLGGDDWWMVQMAWF